MSIQTWVIEEAEAPKSPKLTLISRIPGRSNSSCMGGYWLMMLDVGFSMHPKPSFFSMVAKVDDPASNLVCLSYFFVFSFPRWPETAPLGRAS